MLLRRPIRQAVVVLVLLHENTWIEAAADDSKSICLVFSSPKEFHEKEVRVVGNYIFTDEGNWLYDSSCKGDLLLLGRKVERTIWIDTRRNPNVLSDEFAKTRELHRGDMRWELVVTAEGTLEFVPEAMGTGPPAGGFGHMAGSPARLLATRVLSAQWRQVKRPQ